MTTANDILDLYARKGGIAYAGEGITQLEHAWQCGQLALQAGATPALQLASWLHDLGHLMTDLQGSPTLDGIDDLHENLAAAAIEPLWGATVSEPVRLHVQAKRYLAATYVDYARSLSADSVRSLALQGGPMNAAESATFRAHRYAHEAKQLRAWDDAGKRPGWFAPDTQQALDELKALMQLVT